MKYHVGQTWKNLTDGSYFDVLYELRQREEDGRVALFNTKTRHFWRSPLGVADPNNISYSDWNNHIKGTGTFQLIEDTEKNNETQTKENEMSLSIDKVYRVTQGQLGGMKLSPERLSCDNQFAFFKRNGKDIRVHAKHLSEMPGALISEIDSKEKESMSQLHLVANTYVSSESLKRIEQLKHSLREKTETNMAEVKAITEGVKQPEQPENGMDVFFQVLAGTTFGVFFLVGLMSTIVFFINLFVSYIQG